MKHLKFFEKYSEFLDIHDLIVDLNDDLDIVNTIEDYKIDIKEKNLEKTIIFNRNIHIYNNIDEMENSIHVQSKILDTIKSMSLVSDLKFEFGGTELTLKFDLSEDLKKLLSKINNELRYQLINKSIDPNFPLSLDFYNNPRIGSAFKVNNDFSCNMITKAGSWQKIGQVNKSTDLQDLISKEFEQYGFYFVRKWVDEEWSLEPYGNVMWFEFKNDDILKRR